MEKRRTIGLGKSTLVISLPSKWVKKTGVKAGNYVNLTEDKRGLLYLSTEDLEAKESEVKIEIPPFFESEGIRKVLQSSYISGYDKILVVTKESTKISKDVEEAVKDLIGFEIVNQTHDSFTIKDIGGKSSEDIGNLVRRSFYIVMELSKDSLDAFKSKNNNTLKDLAKRNYAVEKLCFFSMRQLNKSIYDVAKIPASFAFITLTQRLADLYSDVCNQATNFDEEKLRAEVVSLWDHTNCVICHIFEDYHKIKFESFLPLFKKRKEIGKITDKLISKSKDVNSIKLILLFQQIIEICHELMFSELIKEA